MYKVAFRYISTSGGSRLDQIWTRPAIGTILQIVKATIMLKLQYPTDHTPVLADILSAVPLINEKPICSNQPKWRSVFKKSKDRRTKNEVVEQIRNMYGIEKDEHRTS